MKKSAAFTLLEALITVGLVLFVFTIAGGLVTEYLQTQRFSAGIDTTMEAAQTALNAIRSEAGQAIRFTSPVPGGGSQNTLTFEKVIALDTRLPDPDLPLPATWEPQDPAYVGTLTFNLSGDQLVRSLQLGGTATKGIVARGIKSFTVVFLATGNLSIQLITQESEQTRTLTSELFVTTMR